MVSKSRLGRGLGALFPSLPGEEPAKPAAEPEPAAPTPQPARKRAAAAQPTHARKAQPAAPAEADKPAGPVSPLESTIPSMGEMTRHAATVSKLAAPMTLQPEAAEHRPVAQAPTKPQATAPAKSAKRAAMPAIGDMAHPSDMFFDGTPIVSKADAGARQAGEPQLRPVEGGYLVELETAQIGPNLHQPRTVFNDDELRELAESIKEVGVLQPIVVRKRPAEQIRAAAAQPPRGGSDRFADRMDSEYELIMGERRWRASQLAGLTTIPAIVKTTADDYMLRDALLENLHRVALNPLEEAAAYQQMIDEFGLTQLQLAKSVSKSRPQIANTLRLMNLPASVQKRVVAGQISAGHARALLGLPSDADMEKLAQRIVDEGLSVRSVEEIVSMQTADQPKKPKANKHNPWAGSPIQLNLEKRFDTKVSIKGSEQHGRIEIVFSSPEEMDRIIELLDPR
ncbi:chromosome partitioning protein ParB [Bifidobacterium pseudolongum subsp. globosum]|uniref:Chromosome partitioning protein ParB n=1 Tax=Bifidobacterium pseudolongum subsp. globosum TaxID=1690 RepID=A0A2N3QLD6_9BIFI|nr:ParB/RepB/Spo0J family partition protein [Bifidobacterium pseudolongum]PKU92462.1 chromosome partitioning protein ParB [Bifidobacterium pseudolongum subsp. globosum]